jgi:hypothetical protein
MCRCIGTRMSACTAASDDGRPLRARLAAGRATQGGQWGPVQDSYPIHLNPICGARSNSSAADVVPRLFILMKQYRGSRGNFQARTAAIYAILHCLWRTSQETTFHRTTAREPLPSVDHNHACHSHSRASPVCRPCSLLSCETVRYHHIRKETSSCNLYFRRLGIRETVPTRRLPP